ncbi:hypothetical protein OKW45_005297 [Paraburkholderia sp. WSM4175]|uniref:IS66 family transposase zinc-finger binding domain-containing protein n=1 Tax=Paraburkholderia sp. WSM4175 TaxID=2991072 RepID=UPI003D1DC5E9
MGFAKRGQGQRKGVVYGPDTLNNEQMSLLEEAIDADLAAIEIELEQLEPTRKRQHGQPKRAPLPQQSPRIDIHHEPDSTVCQRGCERVRIGEDISEKLDYAQGVFTVERHIRGNWVCRNCETLVQAPVPAHVIDKGIRPPDFSPRYRSANLQITCRCIVRSRSMRARDWQYQGPR